MYSEDHVSQHDEYFTTENGFVNLQQLYQVSKKTKANTLEYNTPGRDGSGV